MSYFKMHQNRFLPGLRFRPRMGSLQRSPDSLAGFKGPTSKGGKGKKGKGLSHPEKNSGAATGLPIRSSFKRSG